MHVHAVSGKAVTVLWGSGIAPTQVRSRQRVCIKAARREQYFSEDIDHYATLQVPRGASQGQIKEAYRRLQKRYHPDRGPAGEGDADRSSAINAAFVVLTDKSERAKHDAVLRSSGIPATPIARDQEGLVGPVVTSSTLVAEALPDCTADACSIDAREEMIHFVRQWGTTLAYVADLPLPLPLQYDQTPNGCRLGLVRIHLGAVQLAGELRFTVVEAEEARDGRLAEEAAAEGAPFVIAVRRLGSTTELPGEKRILRSFSAACGSRRSPPQTNKRFGLSGVLASMLSGAVGAIPFMRRDDSRTYEQFYFKSDTTMRVD